MGQISTCLVKLLSPALVSGSNKACQDELLIPIDNFQSAKL